MSETRRIPDEYMPFCEQSLLNLAKGGHLVLTPEGGNLTESLLAQADRINADFDQALKKMRRRTRIASSPAGAPKREVIPQKL